MSDHAVADAMADNARRSVLLAGSAAIAYAAVKYLRRLKPSKATYWISRIAFSGMGLLPLLAPRPYAYLDFLTQTIWGSILHGTIGNVDGNLSGWSPIYELLLLFANPGMFSGMVVGYLIHEYDWEMLWSQAPGIIATAIAVTLASSFAHQGFFSAFRAIAPTILTMCGPYAFFGYLLGAKLWRYRTRTGEYAASST